MADWHLNYNGTSAPLIVGNLVISGTAGGDEGVRGFVAAYRSDHRQRSLAILDRAPARRARLGNLEGQRRRASLRRDLDDRHLRSRSSTPCSGRSAIPVPISTATSARATISTPIRSWRSMPKTGKLKWYYQFTPHDVHDWDAQEPPVLVDTNWQGQPRKLLLQANRNGFFYVLDRTNGQLLLGKPFLKKLNWAEGHRQGRPSGILKNSAKGRERRHLRVPGIPGRRQLVFHVVQSGHRLLLFPGAGALQHLFSKRHGEWQAGKGYMGGAARPAPGETFEKLLRAINIQTGEIAFDVPQVSAPQTASAGVMSTASGLVFFGENSGSFMAVDAANGKILWQFPTNQVWKASPMTYMFDNKQYVAVAAGIGIIAFGLPD